MARSQPRTKRQTRSTKKAGRLLTRVVDSPRRPRGTVLAVPASSPFDGLPSATLARTGGPVEVEITFGHAQHGKYTIQVFDPTGARELAAEQGVSTDALPDRFTLAFSAGELNGHLVQWSGAVDAFSDQPGQQFSVMFDVKQSGQRVNGGHIEKSGPLNVTQAFLGALVLVTS